MSFKAFSRGLGYHAGAGVGEGIRALISVGTLAAGLAAVSKVQDIANSKHPENSWKDHIKNQFK